MSDTVEVIKSRTGEMVQYQPTNPIEMEFIIRELTDFIEDMPGRLERLNEERYTAERDWSRRRNTALAQHAKNMPVTAARALAEVEALPELERLHNAKAAWHFADDSMKALTSKLYGLLNINKGVQAAYRGYGVGR